MISSRLVRGAFGLRAFAAVWLLAIATPAFGGQTVGPMFGLHTEPSSPRAGQVFVLGLSAMTCHLFWSEDDPLGRVVEVEGNSITITVDYTAPFNGGGCQSGTVRDVEWLIGPFPQGQYTIRLDGFDPTTEFLAEGIDETTVNIGPATLALPSVVPTTSRFGLLALTLAAFALALQRLRAAS